MSYNTYLPVLHAAPEELLLTDMLAAAIFDLMRGAAAQGRKQMVWDALLAEAALYKCVAQAEYGWDGHVSPTGEGPNDMVRRFGYNLPNNYAGGDANYIESLMLGGDGSVGHPKFGAWPVWMASDAHRKHILGLSDFYASQTHVGVGMCHREESVHKYYWCILTCPPQEE